MMRQARLNRCCRGAMKALLVSALALSGVVASSSIQAKPNGTIVDWMQSQEVIANHNLLRNINPSDAARGVVVASPSRVAPNYYFFWVRDAALVMDHVVNLFLEAKDTKSKNYYRELIWDYINFSRGNQVTPNRSGGLGEPKFNVNGSAFDGDWGRPQNDGPALRALTLTKFAYALMAEGDYVAVRDRLYNSAIPAYTVIKADLEFISHHWREANFDLWEESYGDQFYTRMAQRNALLVGARLAAKLDDQGAADWYNEQAKLLATEISKHWRSDLGAVLITLNRKGGIDYKNSGLDSAVILAALHSDSGDGFFDVTDERILASARKIEATFAQIYPINQNKNLGVAIGRYPEDRYDGYRTDREAHPWFIATAGFAELHYRLARKLAKSGSVTFTKKNLKFYQSLYPAGQTPSFINEGKLMGGDEKFQQLLTALVEKGDGFMRRVRQHTADDGAMSEQFNRYNGYMTGAEHLTWSYAALLTAVRSRP